jgi:hypothetical protein
MIEPKTKKGKCLKWFREYDKNVIKQHLIYNYNKENQKAQQEYFELVAKKGHELEKLYVEANKLDKSGRASQIFLQEALTSRNKDGSSIPRFGGF